MWRRNRELKQEARILKGSNESHKGSVTENAVERPISKGKNESLRLYTQTDSIRTPRTFFYPAS